MLSLLVAAQIRNLVTRLRTNNYNRSKGVLKHIVEQYGVEAEVFVIQTLLQKLDLAQVAAHEQIVKFLLLAEALEGVDGESASSVICLAYANAVGSGERVPDLSQLSIVLKAKLSLRVRLGVALAQSPLPQLRAEGVRFVRETVSEIVHACTGGASATHCGPLGADEDVAVAAGEVDGAEMRALVAVVGSDPLLDDLAPRLVELAVAGVGPGGGLPSITPPAGPVLHNALIMRSSLAEDYALGSGSTADEGGSEETKLAEVMLELGYGATDSHKAMARVLEQFELSLDEALVGQALAAMAATLTTVDPPQSIEAIVSGGGGGSPSGSSRGARSRSSAWNVDYFMEVVKRVAPDLKWDDVLRSLDSATYLVHDRAGLEFIVAAYRLGTGVPGAKFPLHVLLSGWRHAAAHLALLSVAIGAAPDVVDFADSGRVVPVLSHAMVVVGSGSGSSSGSDDDAASGGRNSAWRSHELVETLLRVGESGLRPAVMALFERGGTEAPEALALALAAVHASQLGALAELSGAGSDVAASEVTTPALAVSISVHSPSLAVSLTFKSVLLDVAVALLPRLIGAFPASGGLVRALWAGSPQLVVLGMAALYESAPGRLPLLLDVAQDAGGLAAVLEQVESNFVLAMDVAALAARREYLNLDLWLAEMVGRHGVAFLSAAIGFLRSRAFGEAPDGGDEPAVVAHTLPEVGAPEPGANAPADAPVPLVVDVVASFFKALHAASGGLSPNLVAEVRALYTACVQANAKLLQHAPEGSASETFAPEIEAEVNGTLQRMYAGTLSIDALVAMLQRYKTSGVSREQEVFACMIHSLFDEYRFFPRYPDEHLRTTGILFGALIQHGLVTNIPLGYALRYVLEALREPASSKMFSFGYCALSQFSARLGEWPQYCSRLLQIADLTAQYPDLAAFIAEVLATPAAAAGGPDGPDASFAPSGPPGLPGPPGLSGPPGLPVPLAGPPGLESEPPASAAPAMGSLASLAAGTAGPEQGPRPDGHTPSLPKMTNVDTLLAGREEVARLDQVSKDKIRFIFNNLSESTLTAKTRELRAFLRPKHYPYLVHYVVVNRVSLEPKYHELYESLLIGLGIGELDDAVLASTYENIAILLQSEKVKTSSSDRSLLKNLGSWLGRVTLARNKPILYKHLALKQLILDAYSSGRLIAVVPFVAKVLAAAVDSPIFSPPNPWLMGILRLLAELYHVEGLKLNLKFQVEVLCKNLGLDLGSIAPATLLRRHVLELQAAVAEAGRASAGPSPLAADDDDSAFEPLGAVALAAAQAASGADGAETIIPNLAAYVRVNRGIFLFQKQPQLKGCVLLAINRGIKEILGPVVKRSVTIASISTREIILKDFAMEPEENKMISSAHAMVKYLAGSLALVTCKEPLRVSISNHLRSLLQANLPESQHAGLDTLVSIVAGDNLDVACHVVEQAATEKAIAEIDSSLVPAFSIRRKHRERTGQPYYDMSIFSSGRFPSSLPEPLRPKPGGLGPDQQRVYKEFGKVPAGSFAESILAMALPGDESAGVPGLGLGLGLDVDAADAASATPLPLADGSAADGTVREWGEAAGWLPHASDAPKVLMDKFVKYLEEVERVVNGAVADGGAEVGPDSPLAALSGHVLSFFATTDEVAVRTELLFGAARRVYNKLWEPASGESAALHLDVFVSLLAQLVMSAGVKSSNALVTEITRLLLSMEVRQPLYETVAKRLIVARLLAFKELDAHLGQQLHKAANPPAGQSIPLHNVVESVVRLLTRAAADEPAMFRADFPTTIQALLYVASLYPGKFAGIDGAAVLFDAAGASAGPPGLARAGRSGGRGLVVAPGVFVVNSFASSSADHNDPPDARERVASVLEEWAQVSSDAGLVGMGSEVACIIAGPLGVGEVLYSAEGESPTTNALDSIFGGYVRYLQVQKLMDDDGVAPLFFRIATEMAVEAWLVKEAEGEVAWEGVDALSNLILGLVKWFNKSGGPQPAAAPSKVNLLRQVLAMVVKVLLYDYERQPLAFNQKPYFRLLTNLLNDLTTKSPLLDMLSFPILSTFSSAFLQLRPERVPGFAFAWLGLISHRCFMPKLLMAKKGQQLQGWHVYQHLVVALLRFLNPLLRVEAAADDRDAADDAAESPDDVFAPSVQLLYRGTLRLLLVLLHDFPEFLCQYHFSFCDGIPPSCVQMRNLLLSAYPRNVRLPDPFVPGLKVELLPDVQAPPRVLSQYKVVLTSAGLGMELDNYLHERSPASFLGSLPSKLLLPLAEIDDTPFNVRLLNALVLHLGVHATSALPAGSTVSMATIARSPALDIFTSLATNMDPEGRYHLFNAIANQLRYPNSHTHYFSLIVLFLFQETTVEAVKEQITRVLLERLIVSRPHPWGLLYTFMRLIKNPAYDFWAFPWVACDPKVEHLLDSVAQSCRAKE